MAAEIFGGALPLATAYARLLMGPGVERGLIGPGESGRIWERHLLNCAVVAELLPRSCRMADLGSGAGLPGLVLAILRPESEVILIEPMARRTTFLAECIAELGLDNASVCRGRAEELTGTVGADAVTARAVARLDRLAVLADGLARPGGVVLAMKGATAAEEVEQAAPVLRRLGASEAEIVSVGGAVLAEPTTVVRFIAGGKRSGSGPGGKRASRAPVALEGGRASARHPSNPRASRTANPRAPRTGAS